MKINPPASVRTLMYAFMVFINAAMGVLLASDVSVSVYIVAGLAGYNALMGIMAGVNVTPEA